MVFNLKMLVPVIVLGFIAACQQPQDVPAVSHGDTTFVEPAGVDEQHFSCGDDLSFTARFETDSVHVRLPEAELVLPRAVSASGSRYAADGYDLHIGRDGAVFTTPDTAYRDCTERDHHSVWEDARGRRVSFRAVGQEPGWLLEVSEAGLLVETDYGAGRHEVQEYVRESDAAGFTLRADESATDIRVEVAEEQCVDTMSGERFEARVRLIVEGRVLDGCGRYLD